MSVFKKFWCSSCGDDLGYYEVNPQINPEIFLTTYCEDCMLGLEQGEEDEPDEKGE